MPLLALILLCWPGISFAESLAPIPFAGDWNPDRYGDEPGFFDVESHTFNLCKTRYATSTLACVAYSYQGRRIDGGVPLIGRWVAEETRDRPAIYDPQTGMIHLYHYSDCLPETCLDFGGLAHDVSYPLGVLHATPVVGDWDNSGADSVALLTGGLTFRDAPPTSQVRFFRDGLKKVGDILTIPIDLQNLSVISGDWPETLHTGDSLGFYDRTQRLLILFDGQEFNRIHPVFIQYTGLTAFSGSWISDRGTFGLYYPPSSTCPIDRCHRVYYFEVPNNPDGIIFEVPVPNPHLDCSFPDDPGDPGT